MGVGIIGTGSYLPDIVLSNDELGDRLGVQPDWIMQKTAIRERRVAAADEATSDLATVAVQKALESAQVPAGEVDIIVLATSTPDQPMPATACLVQAKLSAHRAAAFDVDAVCTGFIYGLVVARGMLLADPRARTALVIGADTYSRILNYEDRRTAVLFGDGAGAVVLSKTEGATGISVATLGSDGRHADYVQIPAGGSRRPPSPSSIAAGEHYFAMRGGDVRRLANEVFPNVVKELVAADGTDLQNLDLIVPHQANGVMLADWERELGVVAGVMHRTVERYGNTGAASVPVTLDDAVCSDLLHDGSRVLLVAFGGGMTWGGVALTWGNGKTQGGSV
ncbi:3-oxoacyl-ACP synthase III family protein [Amycolatopsis thermoflava]|uniref:3-oxoacyl-ACP synthase III family protein n=1 Tax=Amycolatopsis thermoflava TaxID=84480 RepID=UPI00365B8125